MKLIEENTDFLTTVQIARDVFTLFKVQSNLTKLSNTESSNNLNFYQPEILILKEKNRNSTSLT